MFAFLRQLFPKKKTLHNFSTTLTTAEEGVRTQKTLSPEVATIVASLKKNETVNNCDLNKVISYYFNAPTIEPGLYNIKKALADAMCFEIKTVNAIYNEQGDIVNVLLILREVTFSNDLSLTISVKDFHEMFSRFTFPPTL